MVNNGKLPAWLCNPNGATTRSLQVVVLLLATFFLWPQPVSADTAISAQVPVSINLVAKPDLPGNAVNVRRTTDGIPHLQAKNWHALGVGVGYVQAEDALCTLAEAFVTYAGMRSLHFGADASPARDSTFGRPSNLDLDFFFRAFANASVLHEYRIQQPTELNELIAGFAVGYNRFLYDARRLPASAPQRACLAESWVRPITTDDIYRRLYSAQIAAGYGHLIPEIVNATPNGATMGIATINREAQRTDLATRLQHTLGLQAGLGSNMLAFGREATGEDTSVLLGNPHWYWGGPDRFYQMHLTIPGQLDVAGVAFLGVPVIMIGFNRDVAWTHTVSLARRFGLFQLTLDAHNPTRYQIDGVAEAMTAQEIGVDVRSNDGQVKTVKRRFYHTRFGPVVTMSAHNEALGWSREQALALRDANAGNFRIFRNYFYWNRATSLDDFIAIQRREAAVPWANTAAIARADGRVWYGDIGPVPNVPDALRDTCATDLTRGYAQADPLTPFLDGSRAACDWRNDSTAAQPGVLPAAAMPGLLREDYVANMNDSYWLSNVRQPLEGFPAVMGGERRALSLRGRMGHQIALELLSAEQGNGKQSSQRLSQDLMQAALTPRAYSAEQFKQSLLQQACVKPDVVVPNVDENTTATHTVDISPSCSLLLQWNNRADADSRGALLWDAFWTRLEEVPESELFKIGFSSMEPLTTPRKPTLDHDRVAQALAQAQMAFAEKGVALDATVGSKRFVRSDHRQVPLFGGCDGAGYFTIACNPLGYGGDAGEHNALGPDTIANSYLQVVYFDDHGVNAHMLLAHGLDEAAVNDGAGSAPVQRYARKQWLPFPFSDEQIERDPALRSWTLVF